MILNYINFDGGGGGGQKICRDCVYEIGGGGGVGGESEKLKKVGYSAVAGTIELKDGE